MDAGDIGRKYRSAAVRSRRRDPHMERRAPRRVQSQQARSGGRGGGRLSPAAAAHLSEKYACADGRNRWARPLAISALKVSMAPCPPNCCRRLIQSNDGGKKGSCVGRSRFRLVPAAPNAAAAAAHVVQF